MSYSCDKISHGAYLGSELELDTYEKHFNENLMATKHQELAQAFYSSDFPPAKTFYQGKNNHIGLLLTFDQYSKAVTYDKQPKKERFLLKCLLSQFIFGCW